MRYLITMNGYSPFMSNHFYPENNFIPDVEMIVYDLMYLQYTTDGVTWNEIKLDHL